MGDEADDIASISAPAVHEADVEADMANAQPLQYLEQAVPAASEPAAPLPPPPDDSKWKSIASGFKITSQISSNASQPAIDLAQSLEMANTRFLKGFDELVLQTVANCQTEVLAAKVPLASWHNWQSGPSVKPGSLFFRTCGHCPPLQADSSADACLRANSGVFLNVFSYP